jgi:hypothetical protein
VSTYDWLRDWTWANEFDRTHADSIGIAAISQLLRARRWVNRRIESVVFESDTIASREVTVDFIVPPRLPPEIDPDGQFSYLPLALFKKQKIRLFHLVDGDKHELPVYTRPARTEIAAKGLSAYARGLLETSGEPEERAVLENLLTRIEEMARNPIDEAISIAEAFLPGVADALEDDLAHAGFSDDEQTAKYIELLRNDELFPTIAWNLATHFMLIAPVKWEPGTRRRITFCYEEPLTTENLGLGPRILRSVGLRAMRFRFPAAAAADTRSFHFELRAPNGLQLSQSEFRLTQGTSEGLLVRGKNVEERPEHPSAGPWYERQALELADAEPGPEDGSRVLSRTHLFRPKIPRDASGLVWVNLRPLSTTLLPPACVTSLVVFALLLAIAIDPPKASPTSLLLIAPSALSVYVARSSENPLVTRMLLGIRVVVTLVGLLSFTGAAILVFGCSGGATTAIRWLLAAGAGLCFALLVVTFLVTQRRFRHWAAEKLQSSRQESAAQEN